MKTLQPIALLLVGVVGAAACQGGRSVDDVPRAAAFSETAFQQPEQVTAGNESNFAPDLSPDGRLVFYTSDRKGNKDIWEKRTAGGFARPLTFHPADDFQPVISPDGDRIAMISRRDDAAGDVHILDPGFAIGKDKEGSMVRIASPLTEDTTPSWYPDGKRVVFAARRTGELVPQLMVAGTDDLRPVPLGEARGDQPTVSPDGKQVAFVRGGAIWLYHSDGERTEQVTDGGQLQDGQPRFTQDGKSLVFIRYADDTNQDGKLNGDDRPTIWRLDLDGQRAAKPRGNYRAVPLTAATYAAYSPQIRGALLYVALQTGDGLDIFRLPASGQIKIGSDLAAVRAQFDEQATYEERTLVLRRAQAQFALEERLDLAAETAVTELAWLVRSGRRTEALVAHAKIGANFGSRPAVLALAELAVIELALSPLAYPQFQGDLTQSQTETLQALLGRIDRVTSTFQGGTAPGVGPAAPPGPAAPSGQPDHTRVLASAALVRAKILASQRQFFAAEKELAQLLASAGSDRALSAPAALYMAMITPAISGVEAGTQALRGVVATYPDNQQVVELAAQAAVRLLDAGANRLQALVALRDSALGLPVMPALAHMRIADLYAAQDKPAVTANELRQIVDSYPESPELMLEAAKRLSYLEEKADRYPAAEAMLKRLHARLTAAKPEHRRAARALLVAFYLRRGESWLKRNEPGLAIKEYRHVTRLEPLNTSAHRGILDANARRGTLADAADAYAEAAAAAPASAAQLYFHGYAATYAIDSETSPRRRLAAIDAAVTIVESARQLDPQILHVHQTLGWLYLQKGYWQAKYYASGSVLASARQKVGMVQGFFGAADPNWLELAIDSFQTAYFLSQPESIEQAGLARNLAQAYYELKNYQKSLGYFMQRIKLLATIPMRDDKSEGLLLRQAGRSAFQTDELALAESLQKNALAVWERVNDDVETAYSLDALALTLREQGRFHDALPLYERLRTINERLGVKPVLVGTLSNLGYCAFMDGQATAALAYFDAAEAALSAASTSSSASKSGGTDKDGEAGGDPSGGAQEAIKVDLGGQGSAAKGFDLFARRNLIYTFRAKIYEKMGRHDLAQQAYEEKLALLFAQRERLIADGKPKKSLAEDIAVLQNNLAALSLAAGYHLKARAYFRDAEVTARLLRPEDQTYKSQGEILNQINQARVELRLAVLGLLPRGDATASIKELEQTSTAIRPVFAAGAKQEGRALAQMLALSANLRALTPGTDARQAALLRRELEESLLIGRDIDAVGSGRDGALLAYADLAAVGEAGAGVSDAVAAFRATAAASPRLAWRALAAAGEPDRAFEALDRYVYGGGTLRSPTDRQAAREIFEQIAAKAMAAGASEQAALLYRRYLLLRHTDLVLRSFPEVVAASGSVAEHLAVPRAVQRLLAFKDREQLAAALGSGGAALIAHRTLRGQIHFVLLRADKTATFQAPLGGISPPEVSQALAAAGVADQLPTAGTLYIVPSAELGAVAWDRVQSGGQRLGDRLALAYLPVVDMLPTLRSLRSLPKSTLGHVALAGDSGTVLAANTAAGRDYRRLVAADGVKISQRLPAFDLLHVDTPVMLNDTEPGHTVVKLGETGADFTQDLTAAQLAGLTFEATAALILTNVQHVNADLVATGEGHDGWVLLSLATAAAGVPSVVALDNIMPPQSATAGSTAPAAAAPPPAGQEPAAPLPAAPPGAQPSSAAPDWQIFYQALTTESLAAAVAKARLPARVLGYAGLGSSEEKAYAEEHFETALEEAEDAYDDGEFAEAVSAYKKVLYFALLLGRSDEEDDVLDRLVKSLFQLRDYDGALQFKKKVVARLSTPSKSDAAVDPVDYGNAVIEAAVLAVRAQLYGEADQLLAEAERVFKEEEDAAQLGKVYHYRALNLQNQKKYDETIAAFETSRTYYAKVNPEQAASRTLDIGTIYLNNLSNYGKALTYYADAAAAFKQLGKPELYIPVLIDKANAQLATSDLESAINSLEQEVIPAIDQTKQLVVWVRATQILANAYYRAGLYQQAKDLNERTLAASARIESKQAQLERQLDAMGLKGMILAKLGQYKDAFQEFKVAIDLARANNLKGATALLYNNYGFWAREYGAVDQSLEFFLVALQIDEELKSRSAIAFDQRNMGLSVILKGDFNRARSLLVGSLATSEELGLAYNAAYCHFGLGDLSLREGKWAEAETHFRAALKVSERGYMQDFVWRARAGIAAAARQQGRMQEAETEYAKAVALVEGLRAGLKSDDSRNAFLSDAGVQQVYEAYAVLLMERGGVEESWQLSERARARAFIDALGTQKIKFAKASSSQLLDEERRLRAAVESLQRSADGGQAPGLAEAQARHQAALQQISAVDRQLAQFVRVEAVSKGELAQLLPPETAVVEYLLTAERLLIWVIQNGVIQGKAVPVDGAALKRQIQDFRTLMQNVSSTAYLGSELSAVLLGPVQGWLGGAKRLAIVPHGALHFLPFAALPWPDVAASGDGEGGAAAATLPAAAAGAGGEYLVDKFSLYYLESAAVARFTHGAASKLTTASKVLSVLQAGGTGGLGDLPFAVKETAVIPRYFPRTQRVEGAAAGTTALRAAAGTYDVIHIAAHADFKPTAPGESRLLLAAGTDGASGRSGEGGLSVNEIFGLNLRADLVTLSACETGLGALSSGDEIIGMNRAFFYAGANTVVSSLWRISDVASGVTMKRFYRYLSEGQTKADAMAEAQKVVRRYFKHPAYWSAFRVLGGYQ